MGVWGLYKTNKNNYLLKTNDVNYLLDIKGNILEVDPKENFECVEVIWKVSNEEYDSKQPTIKIKYP